jgi:hypothetical protein
VACVCASCASISSILDLQFDYIRAGKHAVKLWPSFTKGCRPCRGGGGGALRALVVSFQYSQLWYVSLSDSESQCVMVLTMTLHPGTVCANFVEQVPVVLLGTGKTLEKCQSIREGHSEVFGTRGCVPYDDYADLECL